MTKDVIAAIEIDEQGALHVHPATQQFPHAYREAMDVAWNGDKRTLSSPKPRQWSYGRWFQQSLKLASAQGVQLRLDHQTQWRNVPDEIKQEIQALFSTVAR